MLAAAHRRLHPALCFATIAFDFLWTSSFPQAVPDPTAGRGLTGTDGISAESPKSPSRADLGLVGSGELLRKTPRGLVPLPVEDIDVKPGVTGIMVHGTVTQAFTSPDSETIEALYVFPLPDRAAANFMEIRIGDRRIVSVVKEREEAKSTYENAKREGKKAALLDQQRPNLLTTSVANNNPGETVRVRLEYLEEGASA